MIDPRLPRLVPGFDAPFFQAALAGYSERAMRLLARRHGCPLCFTEAALARRVLQGGRGRKPLCADAGEGPLGVQLIGEEASELARAAESAAGMGCALVELNLACPTKRSRRQALRGGNLLAHPELAIESLRAVRAAVPSAMPTTVKLRSGFDDSAPMRRAFERILDAAYEAGYAWATVHARTVQQRYTGPARWALLTELVRQRPGVLLLGSGDAHTAGDVVRLLEQTGVHAVAVARGAIGNPWIFDQLRRLLAGEEPREPTLAERGAMLVEYLDLAARFHGPRAAVSLVRKVAICSSTLHPERFAMRAALVSARSVSALRIALEKHFGGPA